MKDTLDMLMIAIFFLGCTAVYYFAIIQPRDAILYEVIDCMGDDLSQESYELCYDQRNEKLNDNRAPPG